MSSDVPGFRTLTYKSTADQPIGFGLTERTFIVSKVVCEEDQWAAFIRDEARALGMTVIPGGAS